MANLFSNPSHKANIGYNGFDMSKLVTFSSTTGELRPIYFDVLQPGDKVRCSSELRTRTLPLATPAMCEIVERIEWFFVPLDQLYHRFGDWFFGINDPKSSLYNVAYSSLLPNFSAADFTSCLKSIRDDDYLISFEDLFDYKGTMLRVMEDLGIPIHPMDDLDANPYPVGISPLIGCAYQKIYNDFYRLTDREQPAPITFNLDSDYSNPQLNNPALLYGFFQMRYRPRRKDFFTYNLVSPVFGQNNVSSSGTTSVDLTASFKQWLLAASSYKTVNSAGNLDSISPTAITPEYISSPSLSLQLSPTNIRTSFAVDKLLAITQRNAKRVDSQQLAHFGVDLRDGFGTEVKFLGKSESSIQIGDVISNADTGVNGKPLGALAGKGYNYNKSNQITYTADRHGVLMAIYSAEPLSDYPSIGIDPLNQLINSYDFPRPEFDNLGMQPLFGKDIWLDATHAVWNSSVLGWQYRWSQWKSKFNKVTGALRIDRSLENWKVQFFRDFANDGMTLGFYFVSPNDLDQITNVNYSFAWPSSGHDSALYSTDPLIHECFFDVKKSSKMSTYGLEQL